MRYIKHSRLDFLRLHVCILFVLFLALVQGSRQFRSLPTCIITTHKRVFFKLKKLDIYFLLRTRMYSLSHAEKKTCIQLIYLLSKKETSRFFPKDQRIVR